MASSNVVLKLHAVKWLPIMNACSDNCFIKVLHNYLTAIQDHKIACMSHILR